MYSPTPTKSRNAITSAVTSLAFWKVNPPLLLPKNCSAEKTTLVWSASQETAIYLRHQSIVTQSSKGETSCCLHWAINRGFMPNQTQSPFSDIYRHQSFLQNERKAASPVTRAEVLYFPKAIIIP